VRATCLSVEGLAASADQAEERAHVVQQVQRNERKELVGLGRGGYEHTELLWVADVRRQPSRSRRAPRRGARLQQNALLVAGIALEHVFRAVRQRQHPQSNLARASAFRARVLHRAGARLQLLRVQQALAVDVYHVEKVRRELEPLLRRHSRANLSAGRSASRWARGGAWLRTCMLDSGPLSAMPGVPYACTTAAAVDASSARAWRVSSARHASGARSDTHLEESG